MAEVVYLKPGEAPPDHRSWVLVSRDLRGCFTIAQPKRGQGRPAYLVPAGLGKDLALAVETAGMLADYIGAQTVVVETTRAG